MSRAERLLELLQSLRLRRRPVAGHTLAEELGVSLRTLYRDIEALKAQGARIEGEAGFGYVLKPGFTLPPLMFSLEEVEAFLIKKAMARFGNVSQAARALGLSRSALYRRLERYKL